MSLIFTPTPDALIISGKTFHAKEQIKRLGGKWSGSLWTLPLDADTPENRAFLESAAMLSIVTERFDAAAERAYAKSPAGKAEKAANDFRYAKWRGWTCCDEAYVMDIDRGHVGCNEHGFFVKGRLRTGD